VGVEIVEDNVDLAIGMCLYAPVHEVEELNPAASFVMPTR
jgi:hypothetical protein